MEIHSKSKYPANALSNFSPHPFELDGVKISFMEGFLQSLKFKNPEMQKEICSYVGIKAKKSGAKKNWQEKQKLWWLGKEFDRDDDEYQILLDRAFEALSKNSSFCKAILATNNAVLEHNIGKKKKSRNCLD